MKVLFNFNEYVGGGETLLLRLAECLSTEPIKVLTSKDSYIDRELSIKSNKNIVCSVYNGRFDYSYLSQDKRKQLLTWLDLMLSKENEEISIVTFCMRDLHIVIDYLILYGNENVKITHLLLHPLDHLYLGQTLFNKIISKIFNVSYFSQKKNIRLNTEILNRLAEVGSLIPMNFNTANRVMADTGINFASANIIPLPFYESLESNRFNPPIIQNDNENTRLVWLGRIVDFKIPAIKAMIDFVSDRDGFTFDIVGYGNISVIKNYIISKKAESKVSLVGKIPRDSLREKLSGYDIGYAMGTSMAELVVCGLPVIVAIASPDYRSFSQPVCGGLVHEQDLGNFGDNLYCSSTNINELPSIEQSVKKIKASPQKCLSKSIAHLERNFSLSKNIDRYKLVIESNNFISVRGLSVPFASRFRKFAYKVSL
jgi:hypothetical protein